jgi:hypothetical protein
VARGRATFGFTPRGLRALRALRTPHGVQRALDAMRYHHADTSWSPGHVLRERTAHCLEGAIFAAAALRVLGFPPLLLDFEAVQDTDHVIAVFKLRGHWGAIAKSNFSGLRYREPVYRTLRELVMSYFDDYWNLRGERTMRRYSRPVNLARFDRAHPDWMTTEGDIWFVAERLCDIPHISIFPPAVARHLTRTDQRSFGAGLFGRSRG